LAGRGVGTAAGAGSRSGYRVGAGIVAVLDLVDGAAGGARVAVDVPDPCDEERESDQPLTTSVHDVSVIQEEDPSLAASVAEDLAGSVTEAAGR
jgi:hypothetical protein